MFNPVGPVSLWRIVPLKTEAKASERLIVRVVHLSAHTSALSWSTSWCLLFTCQEGFLYNRNISFVAVITKPHTWCNSYVKGKGKGLSGQAKVAQGVPGRLMPRIYWRFGTTRVVGRQPNAPATFTPGEIPGTHFQKMSRPQGTWFCRGYHGKIPSDTTGNRSRDLPSSSAVP